MLGIISVPQPQPQRPPRPTLVMCCHQTVNIYKPSPFVTFRFHSFPAISLSHNFCIFDFTKHNLSLTCSGKVDGMVTITSKIPYFAIINETPYASYVVNMGNDNNVFYGTTFCNDGPDHVASGQTWTASTRIPCIVSRMDATLFLPQTSTNVKCTPYLSVPGTTNQIFSILMKGDDACCVLSSHETQKCD